MGFQYGEAHYIEILLYVVNDIYSGVIYSWTKLKHHCLCIQFESTFKVKLGNTMLEIILVKDAEYWDTHALQWGLTDECEG